MIKTISLLIYHLLRVFSMPRISYFLELSMNIQREYSNYILQVTRSWISSFEIGGSTVRTLTESRGRIAPAPCQSLTRH